VAIQAEELKKTSAQRRKDLNCIGLELDGKIGSLGKFSLLLLGKEPTNLLLS
jgi:hypothetical protein